VSHPAAALVRRREDDDARAVHSPPQLSGQARRPLRHGPLARNRGGRRSQHCRDGRSGLVEDDHAGAPRPGHARYGPGRGASDRHVAHRRDAGVLQNGHRQGNGAAQLFRLDRLPGRWGEVACSGIRAGDFARAYADDGHRRARGEFRGAGNRCLGDGAARDDEQDGAAEAGDHGRVPGIQSVPASGTLAMAAASIVSAARSSGSRLCTSDLPQARASMATSMVRARR
jgi:hypothetical protein